MTEEVGEHHRRVEEVLAGVEYGPKRLVTVTDAEVLALDGAVAHRVTPLLSIDPTNREGQQAMVDRVAKRLFEIGRTADGSPLGHENTEVPEPSVRTVLRMRKSWLALLLVDQRTASGRQWISVYLRADRRALAEVARLDGQHTFTALKRGAALDAVARELTPIPDAVDEDGFSHVYSTGSWQQRVDDTLSAAKGVTTVVSVRHDGEAGNVVDDRMAVYNLADRTEILAADKGGRVRIAQVARRTVRNRLDHMTRPTQQ